MKKKLLALAVAGAFVAPVAMADTSNVNIYGVAHVSFDSVSNGSGATAGTASVTNNKVSSNATRIGFKGSEDLGSGTSAIWQIESQVNLDQTPGTANTLGTRNTFAGLSGDSWGSVVLGINDSPYKSSTRRLDLFADTIADNRTLMGGAGASATAGFASALSSFDARRPDSITYASPSMSGMSVAFQYSATPSETAATGTTKGDVWSLAGMYDVAPLYVALAYESHSNTVAAAAPQIKERAWRLGADYKVDQFEANFVYENTNDDAGGKAQVSGAAAAACAALTIGTNCYGHNAYTLSGKYNVTGNDAVKLAYTKAKEVNMGGGANKTATDANQFSIGYDHSMSKRTTVYALYTKLSNNSNVTYGLGAVGYSTGGTAAAGAGADPYAWSLGLKHVF